MRDCAGSATAPPFCSSVCVCCCRTQIHFLCLLIKAEQPTIRFATGRQGPFRLMIRMSRGEIEEHAGFVEQ